MQGNFTFYFTGGDTFTRVQSVTPSGTQIVREYQETVHREFTPGAPISQEERNRLQQVLTGSIRFLYQLQPVFYCLHIQHTL